jgi:acyl dehydratase
MTTTTSFHTDALDAWTDEVPFTVEKERAIAYAEATNDENPRHLSGELAPPVFAVVPIWNTLGPSILGVVPAEILPTVLHGEQDIFIHQPIKPGMELVSRAKPVGIHAAGSGVSVNTFVETKTKDGEPVNEQWMTSFFRGAEFDGDAGESAPGHRVDPADRSAEPIAAVEQGYDSDQTFRYSEASGDLMPIHLDEEIAKQVGLPGIIIHGLCTMAFNSRAVIAEAAGGDPERLKRLAVRFSKTAFPGQTLKTSIYSAPETNGNAAVAFESETDAGTVIKDGLAEIAP